MKLMNPIFKKLSRHPTFMFSTVPASQYINNFKTLWFNRLSNDKHLKSLSIDILAANPGTLLCFLPEHFSPFKCKILLDKHW